VATRTETILNPLLEFEVDRACSTEKRAQEKDGKLEKRKKKQKKKKKRKR